MSNESLHFTDEGMAALQNLAGENVDARQYLMDALIIGVGLANWRLRVPRLTTSWVLFARANQTHLAQVIDFPLSPNSNDVKLHPHEVPLDRDFLDDLDFKATMLNTDRPSFVQGSVGFKILWDQALESAKEPAVLLASGKGSLDRHTIQTVSIDTFPTPAKKILG